MSRGIHIFVSDRTFFVEGKVELIYSIEEVDEIWSRDQTTQVLIAQKPFYL